MANTIKDLCEEKGILTPEAFAYHVGVSVTTVLRAERGEQVSRTTAGRIASVLGKKPHEISDLNYRGKRNVSVANVHPEVSA